MRRALVVLALAGCRPTFVVGVAVGTTTTTGDAASTTMTSDSSSGTWEPQPPRDWPASFISDPDGGSVSIECDVWDQDCRPGEKCLPWAGDGGNAWNATRCSPVAPDPGQPGDPCTVQDSGVSGVDSCDVATMCWSVDPATLTGTCVAMCRGSENAPYCVDAQSECTINGEGTLILCLPFCHPLRQDCGAHEGCWGTDDYFICAPDASGEMGAYGDPCEYINVCDPGLFCANPDGVPGCTSAGCCSPYCDLNGPNDCPADLPCVPAFEAGYAPPGYEDVGVCFNLS